MQTRENQTLRNIVEAMKTMTPEKRREFGAYAEGMAFMAKQMQKVESQKA